MTFTDKHIVEAYSSLLEGLNTDGKKELIDNLSKSLQSEKKEVDRRFYESFGAFVSDKSAEEIVADIKESRHFRDKEINF